MTRPRVILGPSGAYLVRAVTRRKEPLLAPAWAAELLVATVAYFRHALAFRLYAYVVLPDVFEAVIQPSTAGTGLAFGASDGRAGPSPAGRTSDLCGPAPAGRGPGAVAMTAWIFAPARRPASRLRR